MIESDGVVALIDYSELDVKVHATKLNTILRRFERDYALDLNAYNAIYSYKSQYEILAKSAEWIAECRALVLISAETRNDVALQNTVEQFALRVEPVMARLTAEHMLAVHIVELLKAFFNRNLIPTFLIERMEIPLIWKAQPLEEFVKAADQLVKDISITDDDNLDDAIVALAELDILLTLSPTELMGV